MGSLYPSHAVPNKRQMSTTMANDGGDYFISVSRIRIIKINYEIIRVFRAVVPGETKRSDFQWAQLVVLIF